MKEKEQLKFSICMPAYNGGEVIGETIKSILSQSFRNYELIIVDDNSTDGTAGVIKGFKDPRIKYFKNKENLGYSRNLEVCRNKAKNEILFLMGQDDILGKDALLNTYDAFKISDDVGAVTRSYFWFDKDINTPVRAKDQLNPNKDEIVTIEDNPDRIIKMFKTIDQLSGLAYRRRYMDLPFHEDIFPCHVYPFTSIFKKHPVVFLRDYNVAVRIGSSQTRRISSIYDKSPLQSWVDMFETVFFEKEFQGLKNYLVKNFVATNYVGLVQIRNYARYRYLLREIWLLLKYRWENVLNLQFWFFSLGCLVTPPFLLTPLVDWYKNNVNAKLLKNIKFEYYLKDKVKIKEKYIMMKRIEGMNQCLVEGRKEVWPAKWWIKLNIKNIEQLSKYGYSNFKRTIVKNYFTWSLIAPWNPQVIFLISHVKLTTTIKNIFRTIFMLKHKHLTLVESLTVSFLTLMVWEYAKIKNADILDKLKEPTVGNPPQIYLKNKLISQDLANSVIEFKSIMEPIKDNNFVKPTVIGELGGGYGRNAYVFISMMQSVKYIMIDIPPALYVAERYLSQIFPQKKIFKFREFNSYDEIKGEFEKSDVLFFVPSQIEFLPDKIIDIFINISSLHEMKLEQIEYYFKQIERLTKNNGYLYIKQWKDSKLPFEDDDIHIKMNDYPIQKWTKIFWREAKVQTQFFEALLRLN